MSKKNKQKKRNAKEKQMRKQIQERQKQMVIAYYKRNPDIFVERELGVKLYAWQKVLLNFIFKWGFNNG